MSGKIQKAVLYCRVSTTEQKERGSSLDDQEKMLINYCRDFNIEIVNIYKEDYSAKTFNRPQFKDLLTFVKKNRKDIDFVLVYKWDRFSRNMEESFKYISIFRELGVEVNATSEWIDLTIPQNLITLSIYLANPQVENMIRSDRTKRGMRARLKEGRWCSSIPIGYLKGRDIYDKPLMQIDKTKSSLINSLFKDFSSGNYTKMELRKKYHKLGLNIGKNQLDGMLKNPIYCGKIVVPANEDEPKLIVDGLHEPIISEDMFGLVQKVIRGKYISRRKKPNNINLYLRGLVKCSNCGHIMTGSNSRSKNRSYYSYYHCNSIYGCKSRINADTLHKCIEKDLIKLKPKVEVIEALKLILKQNKVVDIRNQEIQKNKYINNLDEIEDKKEKLTEKYINDKIDETTYNEYKAKYEADIEEVIEKIDGIENKFKDIDKFIESNIKFFQSLGGIYEKTNIWKRKKLLSSIIENNIEISNNSYRTPKFKEVVNLICSNRKELEDDEKKKED